MGSSVVGLWDGVVVVIRMYGIVVFIVIVSFYDDGVCLIFLCLFQFYYEDF